MASAENATDAISRRVRPSRRDQRIESSQPGRRRSWPKWQHWRRDWNDTDKRNRSNKRQMRRRRRHTKWRSKPLDNCRQLNYSPPITWQSRRSRPVTSLCPSARGFVQARTRSPCGCRRPAQKSLEQHRAKVEDIEKALQERRNHLEQLHRQAEASHGAEESPSTCTRRQRTVSRELHTSTRKSVRRRQQQKRQLRDQRKRRWSLTSSEASMTRRDPTPDTTAELQAQTRGDPERLAVLRAQMARDLSSPVPKKKP